MSNVSAYTRNFLLQCAITVPCLDIAFVSISKCWKHFRAHHRNRLKTRKGYRNAFKITMPLPFLSHCCIARVPYFYNVFQTQNANKTKPRPNFMNWNVVSRIQKYIYVSNVHIVSLDKSHISIHVNIVFNISEIVNRVPKLNFLNTQVFHKNTPKLWLVTIRVCFYTDKDLKLD